MEPSTSLESVLSPVLFSLLLFSQFLFSFLLSEAKLSVLLTQIGFLSQFPGSNDYVNNFLQPFLADSQQYTHDEFVELLISTLDQQLSVRSQEILFGTVEKKYLQMISSSVCGTMIQTPQTNDKIIQRYVPNCAFKSSNIFPELNNVDEICSLRLVHQNDFWIQGATFGEKNMEKDFFPEKD